MIAKEPHSKYAYGIRMVNKEANSRILLLIGFYWIITFNLVRENEEDHVWK